jgi:hypothetical protein
MIMRIKIKIKAETPIIKSNIEGFSSNFSNDKPLAGRNPIYVISSEFSFPILKLLEKLF